MINISTFKEQILFSALRVQPTDSQRNPITVGTGFFVRGRLNNIEDKSLVLLVSNKHVFEESQSFVVNFHKKSPDGKPDLGSIHRLNVNDFSNVYYPHPDDSIDLACVNLSAHVDQFHTGIYYRFLELEHFLKFTEKCLDTGQRIYFVGYPDGRFDIENNLPIVRTGYIASHPLTDYNGKRQILIDANVIQGSSGSPVFINVTELQFVDGIEINDPNIYTNMFLGVLTETMVRDNKVVSVNKKNVEKDQYVEECIGIGLVYKSTALLELIRYAVSEFEKNS